MSTNSVLVKILSVILLCLATSTPLTIAKTTTKTQKRLSLNLLHRSSIPSFQNESFQDFLENNKQSFLRNFAFSSAPPLFRATGAQLYFVNLSIGEPPVPQYMAFDTGSSVVWVDGGDPDKTFVYKPSNSKTYQRLSCSSPECSWNPKFSCSRKIGSNLCNFRLSYADNKHVAFGYLGLERFLFKTDCGNEACDDYLDDVLFGFAPVTKGPLFEYFNFSGVLGLGPQRTSLIHNNLPRTFSYCIGDIYGTNPQANFLELGDTEFWKFFDPGMYVPLINDTAYYYRADMECISFREACLSIPPDTFRYDGNDPFTGVVFDTGTVFTYLPDVAYDVVATQVDQVIRSKGFGEPDMEMCYDGQIENFSDFPPLSFHFDNEDVDLSLRLEKNSVFYNKNNEIFCMAMIKSSSKNELMRDFTIIGLAAQQNHTMLFDLEQSRLSIKYSSCAF